jgi:hypothetical protein
MSRVRSWVQVAGVSACSLVALAAVAFSVQALVLPRPTHRELVAGIIMRQLLTYRSVAGREQLNGRIADSVCTQSAFRQGNHPPTESVVFGRERLVSSASALARVHGPPRRLATFMAAACPVPLGEMIGNWLDRRAVDVTASRVGGAPAYELRVGWPRRRVALYVSRGSLRPLLVRVRIGRNVGSNLVASIRSRESGASTIEAVRPHA